LHVRLLRPEALAHDEKAAAARRSSLGLLARVLHRRDPTGLVVSGFPFGIDAAELLRAEGLS
jgi:hypothetical protein